MREDKREIMDSYNTLGGRIYEIRYKEEQEAKYDAILERMKPLPSDILLDLGCGTGLLLSRMDSHSVGADLSHGFLSTARTNLKGKKCAHLLQADTDNLPFRASVFSKVFSVTVIQNLPNLERTMDEIKRVGRLGAYIAVTALKKSFNVALFAKALESSGYNDICIIEDKHLKDWIAIYKLKRN